MDGETVSLTFRYTERDYVRAMRAHYRTRLRLWLDIPLIVVFVGAGVYLWPSVGLHWLSIACLVVSGVFALMLIAALLVIPPLIFRRESKFRDEYSLTFSAEHIHFKTAHIDSQITWSAYSRALVDGHSYVLYYGERSLTVIPKRVLRDQQQTFEGLLYKNVRSIVRAK